MLVMIRKLFSLLTPSQVKQFYRLQILVVIMAFTELIGIASIAPFMALVGDISLLQGDGIFADSYQFSGLNDPMNFLFYMGIGVLLMLSLSTAISMFTIWKLCMYATKTGTEISDRLYTYYMQQDWLFHANSSSAYLTKQVATEALRVTDQIIQPLLNMNAKIVLATFISIGIFIYDPIIAIIGLLIFACAYTLLYRVVRKRLQINGNNMSLIFTERFRLMNEGFGGIKDVVLLDRGHDFVMRFQNSGKAFAYAFGTNNAMGQVPRYFVELIAFGSMISLVLVLIKTYQGNLGVVLPVLAVYALAAFKLLPALQQIYGSVAQIKGNTAAFEAIENDLINSINVQKNVNQKQGSSNLILRHNIKLDKIKFTYPNKVTSAINGLEMVIPANSTIGIVGESGSGKSTIVDILLGLLTPQGGSLYVDNVCINESNKRSWQNVLGYVPQNIFLSEGTISENIAFGLACEDINLDQVSKAIQLANLTELINQLPNGLDTKVGERGIQLSGGQRQRIGIARALYHDPDVLVFDEATSALDGITEKIVMEAIHDFSGNKTIIMIAHRLKTVQKCSIIYMMHNGEIIDKGTYEDLIGRNEKFREMADHA